LNNRIIETRIFEDSRAFHMGPNLLLLATPEATEAQKMIQTGKWVLTPQEAVETDAAEPHARGSETLLVAEDDETVRAGIVEMLAQDGYHVISARDGAEALREFENLGDSVDLIVTDVVMPVMSGTELMRRVAAIRPGMRVMFMSGLTGDALARCGIAQQNTVFLQKPFTRDALNNKVRTALDA
jgi:two-component system, cell cycle sensor histidine kinase and response regulator CckA